MFGMKSGSKPQNKIDLAQKVEQVTFSTVLSSELEEAVFTIQDALGRLAEEAERAIADAKRPQAIPSRKVQA